MRKVSFFSNFSLHLFVLSFNYSQRYFFWCKFALWDTFEYSTGGLKVASLLSLEPQWRLSSSCPDG